MIFGSYHLRPNEALYTKNKEFNRLHGFSKGWVEVLHNSTIFNVDKDNMLFHHTIKEKGWVEFNKTYKDLKHAPAFELHCLQSLENENYEFCHYSESENTEIVDTFATHPSVGAKSNPNFLPDLIAGLKTDGNVTMQTVKTRPSNFVQVNNTYNKAVFWNISGCSWPFYFMQTSTKDTYFTTELEVLKYFSIKWKALDCTIRRLPPGKFLTIDLLNDAIDQSSVYPDLKKKIE